MDFKEKKRKHLIRLILTEILMTIAVVLTALVLTLLLIGYRIGRNWNLEQAGMVMIDSIPRGVTVSINHGEQIAKTQTSKMLLGGDYQIEFSKEGYLGWQKKVKIEPGWVRWLNYGRLFKIKRETEKVQEFAGVELFSVAPNRDFLLVAEKKELKLQWFNLRNDQMQPEVIDLAGLLTEGSTLKRVIWSRGARRVVIEAQENGQLRWLMVDLKNPKRSYNLTQKINLAVEKLAFMDGDGKEAFVLADGELYSVNLEKASAAVVADGVEDFTSDGKDVAYTVLKQQSDGKTLRQVRVLRGDEQKSTVVKTLKANDKLKINLSSYDGVKYLSLVVGQKMQVYQGDLPRSQQKLEVMQEMTLPLVDFVPESLEVSQNGRFLTAALNEKRAVLDLEQSELWHYQLPKGQVSWLDNYMLMMVRQGELKVWDFDGTNQRTVIAKKVADHPAVISNDDHWLYYVKTSKNGLVLQRDNLLK